MSFWNRIREFFAGPPLDQRDDLAPDAWDYDTEWPHDAPDESGRSETADDRVPFVHDEREPDDDELPEDPVEIGELVADEDGDPLLLLGLFGGQVHQGYLVVRESKKGREYFIRDEENRVHWPATEEELSHPTTHRVDE